jgi:glycosyltransferase involved in cell wall biosynthesis
MAAIDNVNIVVINPIPSSPIHYLFDKYKGFINAPRVRQTGNISQINHVKFFSLPGMSKGIEKITLDSKLNSLAESLVKEHGYFDCIDVHWTYPDLPVAIKLAKRWGIPCILTLRGMEAFYILENDVRKITIRDGLEKVDHIISLSDEMAQKANETAHSLGKTDVIRNGVDTKVFTYMPKDKARKKLGLSTNETILIGVGSLIKRKGFEHVVSAMEKLTQAHPEKHFNYYILGGSGLEGNFEKELLTHIDGANLNESVHLKGKVDNADLVYWYNAADVFCLSSFGEGSPNVLTEALSCGCPAVATNVGAVPDIMSSEDGLGCVVDINEKTYNKEHAEIWMNAISQVVNSHVDREMLSNKMRIYTWSWCAKKALDVIGKVIKGM